MARAPTHLETTLLHKDGRARAARSARHALLTCALALGRLGRGEQEVLFAVARSYAAAAQASHYSDDSLGGATIARKIAPTSLRVSEGALCAAAKALPWFSRDTVCRVLRAACAYAEAWELDRAAKVSSTSPADLRAAARVQAQPTSSAPSVVTPCVVRSHHVIAERRYSRRSSRP